MAYQNYNNGPNTPSFTFSVPGFTRAVKVLVIVTTAIWLVGYLGRLAPWMNAWFALSPYLVMHGQVWRLASYLFLHESLSHLFWNMFGLWMFGVAVEAALGTQRFYQLYFVCGIGGGLCDVLLHVWFRPTDIFYSTIGASASVFGVLLAYGVMFPDQPVFLLLPPVTVKAKWLVLGYGALEFIFTLGPGTDNVSHIAHLGGMLFAFLFLQRRLPTFRILDGYERWRRRRMQRKFEVYMSRRDRQNNRRDWMN